MPGLESDRASRSLLKARRRSTISRASSRRPIWA